MAAVPASPVWSEIGIMRSPGKRGVSVEGADTPVAQPFGSARGRDRAHNPPAPRTFLPFRTSHHDVHAVARAGWIELDLRHDEQHREIVAVLFEQHGIGAAGTQADARAQ